MGAAGTIRFWRLVAGATILLLAGGVGLLPSTLAVAQGDTGSISGQVTDTAGTPIADSCVSLAPPDDPRANSQLVRTGPDGRYAFSTVPVGRWVVHLGSCFSATFHDEWWNDHFNPLAADVIAVSAGGAYTADARLSRHATVGGRVTGPDGAPLAGICVGLEDQDEGGPNLYNGQTNADGEYEINWVPPSSYRVRFRSCGGGQAFATQWWRDAGSEAAATALRDDLATGGLVATKVDDAELARYLESAGELVRLGDGYAVAVDAYDRATSLVRDECGSAGEITLARFRDLAAVGRRDAQLLLERMDVDGLTRRLGDRRVLRRAARRSETGN